MRHTYIDRYAEIDSFIHRVDPRIKIIAFFIFVLFIVLTKTGTYQAFVLYAIVLFFITLSSRIPFLFIFKKSLAIIPFVVLIGIFLPFFKGQEGIGIFRDLVVKSYLAILCMILLISSTRFTYLLKGMEKLRIPKIFIMIMSFMYRYMFLIIDETQRMLRAKESRSFNKRNRIYTMRTLANIVGILFIRSYERAERVYLAMCSRGFKGRIETLDMLRIRGVDIIFFICVFLILLLSRLF